MDQSTPNPRRAWYLLAFLTLLNVLNFIDRQLLPAFGDSIENELHISHAYLGLLSGLAFIAFYSAIGVFLGVAGDVLKRPRIISFGLFTWSLMTAASGLAHNIWHLTAARVLVGVGEATLTPCAIAMLCELFPPQRRAFAAGAYYLGLPVGMGLSMILAGSLGAALGGWRQCFLLLGGIGVPLAAVIWFVGDPPRGTATGAETRLPRQLFAVCQEAVLALWRSRAARYTIAGAIVIAFSMGSTFFDMVWLQRERNMTQKQAGVCLGSMFLFGGVLGSVLGGWLGDRFMRRSHHGRLLVLMAGQFFLVPYSIALRVIEGEPAAFAVAGILYAASVTYFYGPLFATVQDLVPKNVRTSAVALVVFAVNLFGIAPGAYFTGQLADLLSGVVAHPLTRSLITTNSIGFFAIPLFALAATALQEPRTK